jgi:hypothetical protein
LVLPTAVFFSNSSNNNSSGLQYIYYCKQLKNCL